MQSICEERSNPENQSYDLVPGLLRRSSTQWRSRAEILTEAKAIKASYSDHYCRTQITLDVNLKPYLLQHSIGNHHVIIRGRHADVIKRFMLENGAVEC